MLLLVHFHPIHWPAIPEYFPLEYSRLNYKCVQGRTHLEQVRYPHRCEDAEASFSDSSASTHLPVLTEGDCGYGFLSDFRIRVDCLICIGVLHLFGSLSDFHGHIC